MGGGYRNKSSPSYTISVASKTDGIVSATFSKSSNLIATALGDGSVIVHFKLRYTQTLIPRRMSGHTQPCYSLAFSPDEHYVASASSDGTILVHHANIGTVYANLPVYADSRVPVLFTPDSSAIISCTDSKTLTVRAFDGKVLKTFRVGAAIKDIALSADGASLVVLTDDDRLRFFRLSTSSYTGYIPPYNLTELTSFALDPSGAYVLVGHADGSIYKLLLGDVFLLPTQEPPQLLRVDGDSLVREGTAHDRNGITEDQWRAYRTPNEPVATEPVEETRAPASDAEPVRPSATGQTTPAVPVLSSERYHAIDVAGLVGFLNESDTYYKIAAGADVGYRTTYLTNPVYEGVGIRAALGFPSDNFPTQYSASDGSTAISAPYLFMLDVYVPVGINMQIKQSAVSVFAELAPAFRLSFLMNPDVAISKFYYSFNARITAGLAVSFLTLSGGIQWDSIWGFIPEAQVGIKIKFGRRSAK